MQQRCRLRTKSRPGAPDGFNPTGLEIHFRAKQPPGASRASPETAQPGPRVPGASPCPGPHLVQAVLQHRRQRPGVPDSDASVVGAAGAQAALPGAVAKGEPGDPVRVPDELPCSGGEKSSRDSRSLPKPPASPNPGAPAAAASHVPSLGSRWRGGPTSSLYSAEHQGREGRL